jgi:hypothetical protein
MAASHDPTSEVPDEELTIREQIGCSSARRATPMRESRSRAIGNCKLSTATQTFAGD